MKKFLSIALAFSLGCLSLSAQNDKADNIIGKYSSVQGEDGYKVNFFKAADGTYTAQIYWLANPYNKDGSISYDTKNPDKSLRNTPSDRIVLIKGLKYNAEKKRWDGAKIYDPQRGIKVNVDCHFEGAKSLKLHATVLGIGETVTWTRIAE